MDHRHSSLIEMAKAGNREAFDSLFSEHVTGLLLFIRYRMGSKLRSAMESVDMVQESYLEAFRSFQSFQGKDGKTFYGWVCGIASHKVSDELKKLNAQKRSGNIRSLEGDGSEGTLLLSAADSGPGPKTVAVLREEGLRMEGAFAELSERDQEAIGLRRFENLSSREAATRMGIKESAFNVIYFRAMKRWKELLEKP